jgi:2-methylcitrate dehydratase PrpD
MGAENFSTEAIQAVAFGLPAAMGRIVDRPNLPASRFAAAASLQFLAAALLLDGDIVPARMEAGARAQEDVIDLMDKISVTHAADLDAAYPATWPAHVRVSTASGDHTALVHLPAGHPERALTLPVTINRFRAYSDNHLDRKSQNALIEAVTNMADLSDMAPITAPIRALL